jgi:leukotriene-A4 hydrolase
VTNCNWQNFWLNEGFTKFLERKIDAVLKGSEQFRQFECIDGWRILKKEVKKTFPI